MRAHAHLPRDGQTCPPLFVRLLPLVGRHAPRAWPHLPAILKPLQRPQARAGFCLSARLESQSFSLCACDGRSPVAPTLPAAADSALLSFLQVPKGPCPGSGRVPLRNRVCDRRERPLDGPTPGGGARKAHSLITARSPAVPIAGVCAEAAGLPYPPNSRSAAPVAPQGVPRSDGRARLLQVHDEA